MISVHNYQNKILFSQKRLSLVKNLVLTALAEEHMRKTGEIGISIVTDPMIRKINKNYHASDSATDCITFEYTNKGKDDILMADIIVSADTAASNAIIYKTSPVFELLLYVVHGILHIAGYNDQNKEQREFMNKKALNILTRIKKS